MKSAKSIILDDKFTTLTYGEVIQKYILKNHTVSIDTIYQKISQLIPQIDEVALRAQLDKTVRCNAAILPMLITPKGTFVLSGLSQREGPQKRGVLVNAMGGVDPEDNSILDAALRELDEELGKEAAQIFSPHISHSVFHVRNELGQTLEEVASNIGAYLSGNKRSISFYGLILTPVFLSDEEAQNILAESNRNLLVNQHIYNLAVDFYYNKAAIDVDFVSLAEQIMPYVSKQTQNNLLKLINNFKSAQNQENLKSLVRYLIEITENKKLILLDLKHLCQIYTNQFHSHERFFEGHDVDNIEYDIFSPSLMDALRIFQSIAFSPEELALDTSPLMTYLYQMQQDTRKAFAPLSLLIRQRLNDNFLKPTPHKAPVSKNAVGIAEALLFSSEWVNPRSLSIDGQRQIALGSVYHQFTHEVGTRLTTEEIPSHVAAAMTTSRVNTLSVKPGTKLYQFVRPDGWIGDYYAVNDQTRPDELGISGLVSGSNDPTQTVERVKLTFVVIGDEAINAGVSTAKEVDDTWSINGKYVHCLGGGKQIYMPLTTSGKQQSIVILLSDDQRDQDRVRAVAKKNGVPALTQQELDQLNLASNALPDFERLPADPNELQELAFDAFEIGNIEKAKLILQKYIQLTGLSNHDIVNARAILGCINALSGQMIDANQIVKSFEHFARNSSDINDKKLLFLVHFHLARANIVPAQAISLLNNCLNKLSPHSIFSSDMTETYRSLINLELAIQHNRLASQFSDEITFNDFDDDGRQCDNKFKSAREALVLLNDVDMMLLPPQEQIVFLLEKAFANHRVKNYKDALEALAEAEDLLKKEINSNIYPNSMMEELKLQQLNIKLGMGLCLARLSGTKQAIPPEYSQVEPVSYLKDLNVELNKAPPMKVALLFKRWVGSNANNLFIQGWHNQSSQDKAQGADLISVFRKYIPLDINTIVRDLEENSVLKLDLAYLGLPQPAGINDKDFGRLCIALAKNTSLKSVFMRKFSARHDNKEPTSQRATMLFNALDAAQKNGQRLNYFSCSGSRFNSVEEKKACIQFLENNTSIRILQPSLYDFKEPEIMQEMANAIGNHSTLTTLLTGLFKCKGAGEMLYHAGMSSNTLKFVHPFPGKLDPDKDKDACENITWLEKLRFEKEQAIEADIPCSTFSGDFARLCWIF